MYVNLNWKEIVIWEPTKIFLSLTIFWMTVFFCKRIYNWWAWIVSWSIKIKYVRRLCNYAFNFVVCIMSFTLFYVAIQLRLCIFILVFNLREKHLVPVSFHWINLHSSFNFILRVNSIMWVLNVDDVEKNCKKTNLFFTIVTFQVVTI